MTSRIVRADGTTELSGIKSVVYHEAVNADTDLRPGCVASAYIEVECYGSQAQTPTAGERLAYYQVVNGTSTLVGYFYAEPSIPTKVTYKFIAYDAAWKLDADFSTWLAANQNNFPMTVYQLVSQACTLAGVTLGTSSWPMSTMSVNAFYADGITCRNILQYAAEIAGKFVRCNVSGSIIFDWYTAASNKRIYPSSGTSGSEVRYAYKQDGLTYENFTTTAVARVAVHPVGEDDVAYYYPTNVSSGNTLSITNNALLYGATAATMNSIAQNLYNVMTALGTYRPMSVDMFPNECPFSAGQIVNVTDIQGVSFRTVIMEKTVTEEATTLESSGREVYGDYALDTAKQLVQLAADIVRINKLKVDWAEIGTAIVQTLQANGINADWINAGALRVYDDNNNLIFEADKDTKSVKIGGFAAGDYFIYALTTVFGGTFKIGQGYIDFSDYLKLSGSSTGGDINLYVGQGASNKSRLYFNTRVGSSTVVPRGYIEVDGSNNCNLFLGCSLSLSTASAKSLLSALGLGTSGVLPITIDQGGTGATDAASARTNLGAVNKAGDTMTGNLIRQNSSVDTKDASNGISSGQWGGFQVTDKNGYPMSYFSTDVRTDGRTGTGMYVYNRDSSGNQIGSAVLELFMNKSGVVTYNVSIPAAFRDAIGIDAIDAPTVNTSIYYGSLDNNNWTPLKTVTFVPGVWLVVFHCEFGANASGRRCISFNTALPSSAAAYYTGTQVAAASGSKTIVHFTKIIKLTANTAYIFGAYQNSGVSLSAQASADYIKLCDL